MTNPLFSVVVATGDVSTGLRLALALQPIAGVHVVTLGEGEDLLAAVRLHDALVVVGDASIVAEEAHQVDAVRAGRDGVGFVVVTERPSLSDAVLALRARVDEFFPGDVSDDRLREAVEALATAVRRRRGADPSRRVLVVGASLEAVLLGAGGTVRMHVEAGDRVLVATLDDAVGDARRAESIASVSRHLGTSIVPVVAPGASTEQIRDALVPIVAAHQPAVVYTHAAADASPIHRRVHQIVTEATPDASRVSCFQSAGSSIEFAPTLFVDVEEVLDRKVAALRAWTQDDDAVELARANATYWSRFGSGRACEPFELLRDAVSTRPIAADVDDPADVSEPMQPA